MGAHHPWGAPSSCWGVRPGSWLQVRLWGSCLEGAHGPSHAWYLLLTHRSSPAMNSCPKTEGPKAVPSGKPLQSDAPHTLSSTSRTEPSARLSVGSTSQVGKSPATSSGVIKEGTGSRLKPEAPTAKGKSWGGGGSGGSEICGATPSGCGLSPGCPSWALFCSLRVPGLALFFFAAPPRNLPLVLVLTCSLCHGGSISWLSPSVYCILSLPGCPPTSPHSFHL